MRRDMPMLYAMSTGKNLCTNVSSEGAWSLATLEIDRHSLAEQFITSLTLSQRQAVLVLPVVVLLLRRLLQHRHPLPDRHQGPLLGQHQGQRLGLSVLQSVEGWLTVNRMNVSFKLSC